MKLVLFGVQGAGKSTQGKLLAHQLNLPYISAGHIFRRLAQTKTKQGRYIKEVINSGALLPDDISVEIMQEYLQRPHYRHGFILDGFVRTKGQLEKFMPQIDMGIHIELSVKEALYRISYRDEKRSDETVTAVRNRIELYFEETQPVLDSLQEASKLLTVDGSGTPEEVNALIMEELGVSFPDVTLKRWKRKRDLIIATAGLPASGKTSAEEYFTAHKNIQCISSGAIINTLVGEGHHTAESHKKVATEIRETHGRAAMAILNTPEIEAILSEHQVVLYGGMRSYEEYEHLKKTFPDADIVLLGFWASFDVRNERMKTRSDRQFIADELRKRDRVELEQLGLALTFSLSDRIILNDASIDELHSVLEQTYHEIYFK